METPAKHERSRGTNGPLDAVPTAAPPLVEPDARRVLEELRALEERRWRNELQRFVVDAPHDPHRGSAPTAPQSVNVHGASHSLGRRATRHYRIDAADDDYSRSRRHAPPREAETISGSIFRLHAALAPHRGLVAAAALVLAVSLVSWLAFGDSSGPITAPSALELDNAWSNDEPADAPVEAGQSIPAEPSVTTLEQPLQAWPAAPRVATAAAVSSTPGAPSEATPPVAEPPATTTNQNRAVDDPTPDANANEALPTTSIDLPPAAAMLVEKTASDEAAITPTPETAAYPTTPYPAFTFVGPPMEIPESPAAEVADVTPPAADVASQR